LAIFTLITQIDNASYFPFLNGMLEAFFSQIGLYKGTAIVLAATLRLLPNKINQMANLNPHHNPV
jgi:hypothetical protein